MGLSVMLTVCRILSTLAKYIYQICDKRLDSFGILSEQQQDRYSRIQHSYNKFPK